MLDGSHHTVHGQQMDMNQSVGKDWGLPALTRLSLQFRHPVRDFLCAFLFLDGGGGPLLSLLGLVVWTAMISQLLECGWQDVDKQPETRINVRTASHGDGSVSK